MNARIPLIPALLIVLLSMAVGFEIGYLHYGRRHAAPTCRHGFAVDAQAVLVNGKLVTVSNGTIKVCGGRP